MVAPSEALEAVKMQNSVGNKTSLSFTNVNASQGCLRISAAQHSSVL